MRINSMQSGSSFGAATTAPLATPTETASAIPGDSIQISSTAQKLSAAGAPAASSQQTASALNESFNQLEDRLMQKLRDVRDETSYEAQKLQRVARGHSAGVGKPVQTPAAAPSQPATAVASPPPPTPIQPSVSPFDQLASALSKKVAMAEKAIEQRVDQSTAALQQPADPATPVATDLPPVAVQSPSQQVNDLGKLLTANISQFAQRMDTGLVGLEHAFMARISALRAQPGTTTPSDPLNELLNL
jgi:hypothetical protein